MYVYIDALFRKPGQTPGSPEPGYGLSMDADCPDIRDTPPYLLKPSAVMVIRQDGKGECFEQDTTWGIIHNLYEFLERYVTQSDVCVGWDMDRVIIPSLCANAFLCSHRLPCRLFRKLDEKWSKTAGHSVERAFMQGWYPLNKTNDSSEFLTLDKALNFAGLESTEVTRRRFVAEEVGDEQKIYLMARIAGISALHAKYQDVASPAAPPGGWSQQ